MQPLLGVLLDVDGTLVDSNDSHAQAWVRALAEDGIAVPLRDVRRLIGKGADKLLPEAAGIDADSPRGKAISKRRGELFREEFLPTLRPFPSVRDLLSRMKQENLRLAVASSARGDELEELLRVCGADEYVDARTSSDDAENSKPDPDIVRAAVQKIGLPTNALILLGDTPYDIQAAQRAEVAVVALRCGGWSDPDLAGAVAVYDSPADLLNKFEQSPFTAIR